MATQGHAGPGSGRRQSNPNRGWRGCGAPLTSPGAGGMTSPGAGVGAGHNPTAKYTVKATPPRPRPGVGHERRRGGSVHPALGDVHAGDRGADRAGGCRVRDRSR
jgi:hypothetical protein